MVNISNDEFGNNAFKGTLWYKNQSDGLIYLDGILMGYKGDKPTGDIVIKDDTKAICGRAFYSCSGLTSVTIPSSVTNIGNSAFYKCGLTSVTIPNSVASIGQGAFQDCSGLTSVTIPNSVTSIGNSAFSGCIGLTSVTIPNSVTSIGYWVFAGCSGLTSINVESGNTVYNSRDNSNAIIKTETNELIAGCKNTVIPNFVTSIGNYAFSDCSTLTSVTIPNSVTSIGEGAFLGCSGLTSVTIPESVTSVGGSAFNGTGWYNSQSDGLLYLDHVLLGYKGNYPTGDLVIADGTRVIAGGVFSYGCSGLTSVTIPNSVTSIGNSAFYGCSGLTELTIPSSVTSIDEQVFFNCTSLSKVISLIEEPTDINKNVFQYTENYRDYFTSAATLYVPIGTKEKYEATEGWKEFKTIVEGEPVEETPGDLNGDGKVNVGDIMAIINIMADGAKDLKGDVNGDGAVNVGDIMAIINIMAGQ